MKRKNTGFTLVEILIVVVILGILAAIVIPQFTEASNDARRSALVTDLQTVRAQLELYKVQHLESYPDSNDLAKFVTQLTSRSDATGATGTDPATYPLGPYLQQFPTNPYVAGASSDPDGVAAGTGSPSSSETGKGWFFNTTTGRFSAQGRYNAL